MRALLHDTGIPKCTHGYLQFLTANFSLYRLRVRNGELSIKVAMQCCRPRSAQTEAVWKRLPWPPPIYASAGVSPLMLRGWEGADGHGFIHYFYLQLPCLIAQLSCLITCSSRSWSLALIASPWLNHVQLSNINNYHAAWWKYSLHSTSDW